MIVFELVLSEFKEITPESETIFNEYEDFKQTLKSDYEYSGECLDFYQYFFEIDFNKVYQCVVVKYKLKKEDNEPSLSEFKSYLEMFHRRNWFEEKGDELVIGDSLVSNEKKLDNIYVGNNKIDQRFKKEKNNDKKTKILIDFHTEVTTNMDEKKEPTEEPSIKCPVPGCKFGDFFKIYDTYKPVLIERILTNNGRHDATLAPNWNCVDWNYSEKEEEKEV